MIEITLSDKTTYCIPLCYSPPLHVNMSIYTLTYISRGLDKSMHYGGRNISAKVVILNLVRQDPGDDIKRCVRCSSNRGLTKRVPYIQMVDNEAG